MRKTLLTSRSLLGLLAATPALVGVAFGQTLTNWVAYNDHIPSGGTAANVSGYNMLNGPGGPLTNFVATQYPAGQEVPAVILVKPSGNVATSGTMSYPDAGTPAYDLFNGIVDLANAPTPGILFTLNQFGQVTLTFTNLDPSMRYIFRTTSVRGRDTDDPTNRWTVCTLVGADAFTDAHSAYVITSNTFPTATLTNGQAAYNSGGNRAWGAVVGWDDINPGPDGTFAIVSAQYTGPMPYGAGLANGAYGYGPCGFMLVEVGPLTPASITQQPANATVLELRPFSLSVRAQGTAPYYQWYKEGVGAIAGATRSSYSVPVAQMPDAGDYYVVVSNSLATVTSTLAHVTVDADTVGPSIVTASGNATLNGVYLKFNEPLDPNTATEAVNYHVSDGVSELALASATLTNNGTGVLLVTDPQVPNTLYTVTCADVTDVKGNATTGPAQFRSWIDAGQSAGLIYEYFPGIGGSVVSDLTNNATFPNSPATVYRMTTSFNSREVFPNDTHENYGARVHGLFLPPISGNWRFFTRSDDASQLWLNPGGPDPAGRVLIAQETACCNSFQSYGSPRTSEPIALEAGHAYYMEYLFKEGTGGDWFQVAARLDGTGVPPDGESMTADMFGLPNVPVAAAGTITITQPLADVTITENAQFTFNAAATSQYGYPLWYQWSRWDDATAGFTNIPGANQSTLSAIATLADNGARFKLTLSVPGFAAETEAVLHVQADTTPPVLVSARGSEILDRVVLRFNELLDPTTANDNYNYIISGGIQVIGAVLGPDGKSVGLALHSATRLQPDTVYTVTATNVMDLAGNPIAATNGTVTFHSFVLSPGFLNFTVWDTGDPACGNNAVALLTGNPKYPDYPREHYYVNAFDTRLAYPNDTHEGYGARLAGLFIPPASGDWLFYVSADDDAEVWLNSAGDDPSGAMMIVAAPSCCQPLSAHVSLPISLMAGQPYFIMGLYKEGCGGDYMRVATKLASDPTPPDTLAPISGRYLACYADPEGATLSIAQQPTNTVGVLPVVLLNQNFDAGDGGFTVVNENAPEGPWVYDAGAGSWRVNGDGSGPASSALVSPNLTVTGDSPLRLNFTHRYSFEFDGTTRWDGGQVRLSVNGGAFTMLASNRFITNGYIGKIDGTGVLLGQPAFNGPSPGYGAGAFITSIADLGSYPAGTTLALEFIGSWDEGTVAAQPNWVIDSVGIIQGEGGSVSFVVVAAGTTPGSSYLVVSYQWQRNDGNGWTDIPGANSSTYSFLPVVTDNFASFRVVLRSPGVAGSLVSDAATLTLPGAPPNLATRSGPAGSMVISWPAGASGFVLEETAELKTPSSSTVWAPAGAGVLVDGRMTLTVTVTGTQQKFYRLRQP